MATIKKNGESIIQSNYLTTLQGFYQWPAYCFETMFYQSRNASHLDGLQHILLNLHSAIY
jgi:hypothetical protein